MSHSAHIQTLRVFRTKHFTVKADAYYDDSHMAIEGFTEDSEIVAQYNSGELTPFYVVVKVYCEDLGELSEESLYGCLYTDPTKFMDHRECGKQNKLLRADGSKAAPCGSYFAQMIKEACKNARQRVLSMRQASAQTKIRA